MRARNPNILHLARGVCFALAGLLAVSASWAQETPEAPESPEAPPAPAAAPEVRQHDLEKKEVRILRGEDGSLRIITRDERGERSDVHVDLGEAFGGEIATRIHKQLEAKGILDEKGLVVESALDGVPKNISIGVAGNVDPDVRMHHPRHEPRSFEGLIAIMGILAVFGTPILIVWLVTRNSYRKRQLLLDNINRMVAEGRDIPQEYLDAVDGSTAPKARDRGYTLMAVGLALFIWLSAMAGFDVGSLALIPLFIGIARFVSWRSEQKDGQQAG